MRPVDRFDGEGWFSSDQVIFLTVLCFLVNSMQHLSEKTISTFPVSPGSAEALAR